MFKKAKKLNKMISSLFIVALFGFFACTMHIFPSHNEITESGKVAHHHDAEQNKMDCVDHSTMISNSSKNDNFDPDQLAINNSFPSFTLTLLAQNQNIDNQNSKNPPPKNKVSIFLKNNIFLI